MKLAVVGGGSTYTPGAGRRVRPARDPLAVDELVLLDPDAERLEVVGGVRPPDARPRRRTRRRVTLDHRPRRRPSTGADVVLIQLRVGGQAARIGDETFPLDVRLRRPGDDRRRRPGQGAAHGAGRARHRRRACAGTPRRAPGSSTSPTRSASSRARCSQDGPPAVGLCNVAIGFQRLFAGCSASHPTTVALDHVGLNHLTWSGRRTWTASTVLPELLARPPRDIAERSSCRRCSSTLGACRPTTCATSTPTTRSCEELRPSRPGRRGRSDRARAARDVRRPGAGREAGAARPARRRVLLRGGGRSGRRRC